MTDFIRRTQAVAGTAVGPRGKSGILGDTIGRFLRSLNIWFWTIVGLPTLIAGVYLFGMAANQYSSEVNFVVKSPNKPSAPSGIGALLGGGGGSVLSEEAAVVRTFMLSRDAVRELEDKNNLRGIFSRPEGDFLTRFPGVLFWHGDFEALYRAYGHFVTVDIDTLSGISTLEVKAYRAQDAQAIAKALVEDSEQLVNQLNERARSDAVSGAQHEVDVARDRISADQAQLTAYRISQNMLDPKTAATGPLALMTKLNGDAATARGQLADLLKNSPHSPLIQLTKVRIATLDKLIADERSQITGDDNSVAKAESEYERLSVQLDLDQKLLASNISSLEAARLAAQQQQIYLEVITQPNLADYPLYPKRLAMFATIAASCLLAYGIAWLMISGIREHASA